MRRGSCSIYAAITERCRLRRVTLLRRRPSFVQAFDRSAVANGCPFARTNAAGLGYGQVPSASAAGRLLRRLEVTGAASRFGSSSRIPSQPVASRAVLSGPSYAMSFIASRRSSKDPQSPEIPSRRCASPPRGSPWGRCSCTVAMSFAFSDDPFERFGTGRVQIIDRRAPSNARAVVGSAPSWVP
jgi:hypothetical protein